MSSGNKLIKSLKERIKNIFMKRAEKKALAIADKVFTITEQEEKILFKKNINNRN